MRNLSSDNFTHWGKKGTPETETEIEIQGTCNFNLCIKASGIRQLYGSPLGPFVFQINMAFVSEIEASVSTY